MSSIFRINSCHTLASFKKVFSKYGILMVEELFKMFETNELFLGGSTTFKMFCEELFIPIKSFNPSDLDFFVTTSRMYDRMTKFITGICGYSASYSYDNTSSSYARDMHNVDKVSEYTRQTGFVMTYYQKIQVALLEFPDIERIFETIDISVTKCVFNGHCFISHSDCIRDTRLMTCTISSKFDRIRNFEKVLGRCVKYAERGFPCTYPEKVDVVHHTRADKWSYPLVYRMYTNDLWENIFVKKIAPAIHGEYSLLLTEIKRLTLLNKAEDTEKIAELTKLCNKLKDDIAAKDIELDASNETLSSAIAKCTELELSKAAIVKNAETLVKSLKKSNVERIFFKLSSEKFKTELAEVVEKFTKYKKAIADLVDTQ